MINKGVLEFTCDVERLENGNTLISDAGDEWGNGSEVFEVDSAGNLVWSCEEPLRFAHSAKRLKNHNTLIADTLNDRIIEVDSQGELVFSSDDWGDGTGTLSDGSHLAYPNDAHKQENGNYLITDRNNNRCIIVNSSGTVLWQFSENIKHPHNADLLSNGNILIANSDQDEIWEISPDKQIVWRYGDGADKLSFPRDADRLDNGNTLITDSRNHRVIEVTPDKKIVWEYKVNYYASFYEADRLKNGNTLIADQHHHQILEVAPNGSIVWQFRNKRILTKILPRLTNGFFKKLDANNFPDDWYLYTRFSEGGGRYLYEDGVPGIEFDRHGVLCMVQYIAVRPGSKLHFNGKIKTEDIEEGSFACFQAFFLDCYGGPICNTIEAPKTTMLTGTQDWTDEKAVFNVPEGGTMVELRLMITGKGKAFMKELMMFSE